MADEHLGPNGGYRFFMNLARPERLLRGLRPLRPSLVLGTAAAQGAAASNLAEDAQVVELVLFVCRELELIPISNRSPFAVLGPSKIGAPGEIRTPGLLVRSSKRRKSWKL
jgi:hypothetical protein